MRHRVAFRKLGRVTEHRIAMLRNQAHALLLHEHIETTVPKAKELRPFVERLITIAKRGIADGCTPTRALTARREVLRDIPDRDVVGKLFTEIAPRFASRPGGYTRLLRIGYRQGDAAEVARVELVGQRVRPEGEGRQGRPRKARSPRPRASSGRLRAAADRLRGKRAAEEAEGEAAAVETKSQARAAARKGSGGAAPGAGRQGNEVGFRTFEIRRTSRAFRLGRRGRLPSSGCRFGRGVTLRGRSVCAGLGASRRRADAGLKTRPRMQLPA